MWDQFKLCLQASVTVCTDELYCVPEHYLGVVNNIVIVVFHACNETYPSVAYSTGERGGHVVYMVSITA